MTVALKKSRMNKHRYCDYTKDLYRVFITKRNIRALKTWINMDGKGNICPFVINRIFTATHHYKCSVTCERIFPANTCPCYIYNTDSVVKIIEKLIEINENRDRSSKINLIIRSFFTGGLYV
jgi:hypothetical protein